MLLCVAQQRYMMQRRSSADEMSFQLARVIIDPVVIYDFSLLRFHSSDFLVRLRLVLRFIIASTFLVGVSPSCCLVLPPNCLPLMSYRVRAEPILDGRLVRLSSR